MKRIKRIGGGMVAVALLVGAGCASLSGEALIGDAAVEAEAQARLSGDTLAGRTPVGVSVQGGVATVTGSLRDAGEKARVLAIVKGTPGVTSVIDRTTR